MKLKKYYIAGKFRYYFLHEKVVLVLRLLLLRKKTVFLFGYPVHANMGDQAQAYCIEQWIREFYPEYKLMKFYWRVSSPAILSLLRRRIGDNDIIMGHSGYFFIDHHLELPVFIEVVKRFHDKKIIIMPQTINLKSEALIQRTQKIFNSHPNLTILCRDSISFEKAKKWFSDCRLLLYPDIVTSLIGTRNIIKDRKGVLLCVRNDAESLYSRQEIGVMRAKLEAQVPVYVSDTSVTLSYAEIAKRREDLINELLENYAGYQAIITDRYHGTIFSLIASTPVVVIDSTDHKLRSGVKWFPDSFATYVQFAENLEKAYEQVLEMINSERQKPLEPYFLNHYYRNLKDKLE